MFYHSTDTDNVQHSTASTPISIWKAKDGSVPFFDDPTYSIQMLRWNRDLDITFETIHHRVLNGQISDLDIEVAITLAKARVLTEKQLRYIYRDMYPQSHKLASRLRFLQKIGWFEGWRFESDFNGREHVWSIGIAAKNYLGYGLGMDVPDPMKIAQSIKNCLPICAINEIRIQLIEKGVLESSEFTFFPDLAPNYNAPLALMPIRTPIGKMVMYVERLSQNKRPARFMRFKLKQYIHTVQENGSLYNPIKDSMDPILVWSCGTEEAVIDIVGSLSRFPTEIMQLFLIDEYIDSGIRGAWRVAIKGEKQGDVRIKKFDMDFL